MADVVFLSRDDAERVLEAMQQLLGHYEVVSFADYLELVGLAPTRPDENVGWRKLDDVQIKEVRDGFMLELPPTEPIV